MAFDPATATFLLSAASTLFGFASSGSQASANRESNLTINVNIKNELLSLS